MDTGNPPKEPENMKEPPKEAKSEETKETKDVKDVETAKKPYYVGAHVSSAGGAFNAVENANLIGANAFALFLKYVTPAFHKKRSRRHWAMPSLKPGVAEKFKEAMAKYSSDCYFLVNLRLHSRSSPSAWKLLIEHWNN